MTSAGNDIVALNATNSAGTQQQRFYSKILSDDEQSLYHQAEFSALPFENFVWLLWSVKESAYKFLKRLQPELLFTPVKFSTRKLTVSPGFHISCFENKIAEGVGFDGLPVINGIVEYNGKQLYFRSLMYSKLIMSVANDDDDFGNICWGIKLIGQDHPPIQSAEARIFLKNRIADFYSAEITIEKNATGIPLLKSNGTALPVPVSLSHHGHFVAYSFKAETATKPMV